MSFKKYNNKNTRIVISIFILISLTLSSFDSIFMNQIPLKVNDKQILDEESSLDDSNNPFLYDKIDSLESEESNLRNEENKDNIITESLIHSENGDCLPKINIVKKDEQGLIINFALSDVIVENIIATSGETYQKIDIMEGGHLAEIGKPELPTKGIYLEVPNSVEFNVIVKNSRYYEEFGYNVFPSQKIEPDNVEYKLNVEKNTTFYKENKFFPNNLVTLNEVGIIRGHRTALLVFCPVTYNPVSKIIRVYCELEIEIKYIKDSRSNQNNTPNLNEIARYHSNEFSSFFKSIYLNYDSSLEEKLLSETSQIEADGADYLIITPDEFYDEIIPLAQHKSNKGLLTEIVNLSEIGVNPSANDISTFIQNAYDSWNPAPTYLLLVGDSDLLPPHYKTTHPYDGSLTATDLYYATVDGTDYFPDIFIGRLPVKNEAESNVVVNKIINYEQNFNQSDPWRRDVTLAAYDQYGRYFIDTCENISSFLETKDYDITKIYTGGSYSGTTQDVIDTINNGTFLVNHRDHGEWYGWGDPSFTVDDIEELNNGDILPVMFSINCLSGRFDYYSQDCFAEAILKAENKGVVGCIASTRVSYSGYNDELDKGFIASIWPDYQSSYNNYVGKSAKLGQILNFGKMYMYDKYVLTNGAGYPWGPDELTTKITFEMFTLFGDPELTMLQVDHDLQVSLEIPINPNISTTYVVNATVLNTGVKEMSDINLYLYCDEQIVQNINIKSLSVGENETINYYWTPQKYGSFNFTAYVPPKPEEFYHNNNRITKFSIVRRDLSVDLEVPLTIYLNETYLINATITNIFPSTENDVEFYLKINKDVKNLTCIPVLQFGESYTLIYNWTPNEYGFYNISCNTPLRQGEFNINNNNVTILSRIKRDLFVELKVPTNTYIDESYVIDATIINNGSIEIDIEFYLKIDEDIKNSTNIPTLKSGESYILTYNWTPNNYGAYNITCNTPIRKYESNTINNLNWNYKRINPIIFRDGFENGRVNWNSIQRLWHFTSVQSPWPNPCHSGSYAMWFGQESTGNFETGYTERGSIVSKSINLTDISSAFLSFYHWMDGEYSSIYDVGYVYISIDGINWDYLYRVSYPCKPWQHAVLNISKYCGNETIHIRFFFDSGDPLYNYYRGWLIDDVEIYTDDYNYKQKKFEYPQIPPSLTSEDVAPTIGYPDTLFYFRVNYIDLNNEAPLYINVIINGSSYSMSKQDKLDYDYTNGCTYIYSTYLPVAKYNYIYYFNCSDGKDFYKTNVHNNLRVHLKPTLTNEFVTPKIGYMDTLITFKVNYTDLDNETPLMIRVCIGPYSYNMFKQDILDDDYTDGCIYIFSTTLNPKSGNYSYYFYCKDDSVNSVFTSVYNDLKIHSKPRLDYIYLSNKIGFSNTLFSFQVVYFDADNDAPVQVNLIINHTIFAMNKQYINDNNHVDGCAYIYSTYLPVAKYNYIYYFNCSDGLHSCTTDIYNNLRVHNKPTLTNGSVTPKIGYTDTLITFRVNYTDIDNDMPLHINVFINDILYNMIKQDNLDNNYTDGCVYIYSTYLSPSYYNYSYWFRYSDDNINFFSIGSYKDLKIVSNQGSIIGDIDDDDDDDDNNKENKSSNGNNLLLPIIIIISSISGITSLAIALFYIRKRNIKLYKSRENSIF